MPTYFRGVVPTGFTVAVMEKAAELLSEGKAVRNITRTFNVGQPGPFREFCTLSLFDHFYRALFRGFAFAPKALNQFLGGGQILYILDAQPSH